MTSISTTNKYFYTLLIQYDGTNYYGWQRQPNLPSIQQTIIDTINSQYNTQVNLIGASRTDARVHAVGQVAQLISTIRFDVEELTDNLKRHLPSNIQVHKIVTSHRNFMVIYEVTSKDYYYLFSNEQQLKTPSKYFVNFKEPLNIELMKNAASFFLGTHSFHNFQYRMNPNNSPIRHISEIRIVKNPSYAPSLEHDLYSLEISGTGFLKQMIRLIMGTLINISNEIHTPEDIYSAFHPESVAKLGFIAPADGLHLAKIHYPKDPFFCLNQ